MSTCPTKPAPGANQEILDEYFNALVAFLLQQKDPMTSLRERMITNEVSFTAAERVKPFLGPPAPRGEQNLMKRLVDTTAEQAENDTLPFMRAFRAGEREFESFLRNAQEKGDEGLPLKDANGEPIVSGTFVEKTFVSALKAKGSVSPELAMLIPYLLYANSSVRNYIVYIMLTKPVSEWVQAHNFFIAFLMKKDADGDELFVKTYGEALATTPWPIFPKQEVYGEFNRQILMVAREPVTGGGKQQRVKVPEFLSPTGIIIAAVKGGSVMPVLGADGVSLSERKKVSVEGSGTLPVMGAEGTQIGVLDTQHIENSLAASYQREEAQGRKVESLQRKVANQAVELRSMQGLLDGRTAGRGRGNHFNRQSTAHYTGDGVFRGRSRGYPLLRASGGEDAPSSDKASGLNF